jgi:hypothetical protein
MKPIREITSWRHIVWQIHYDDSLVDSAFSWPETIAKLTALVRDSAEPKRISIHKGYLKQIGKSDWEVQDLQPMHLKL